MSIGVADVVGAGVSAYGQYREGKKKEKEAERLYKIYAEQIAGAGERAIREADIGKARAAEDYAAQLDAYNRAMHLQKIMQQEQLAQRGITTPQLSSIGRSETGRLTAEQAAQTKGLETWRQRKLADIGRSLQYEQEDLATKLLLAQRQKELGEYSWADVVRRPEIAAGMTTRFGQEIGAW